jgi:coenzyme F420 hydrogenase subunit beta
LLGDFRSIWTGHVEDESLRFKAASGGFISALLIYALERSMADRVLVIGGAPGDPFGPRAYLASTAEEVLAGAGSCYLPPSLEEAVREADCNWGTLAVTGLPCHIQAWKKAAGRLPRLAEKISLYAGLFCDHLVDARFHRLLIGAFGTSPDDVQEVSFRGEGWPGGVRVRTADGEEKVIHYGHPLRKMLWKSYFFTPRRCLYCYDALAEFADISAGDAWLPEYEGDSLGRNIVMARSRRGQEICLGMVEEGRLRLEPLEAGRLFTAQKVQLRMKKRDLAARYRVARFLGWHTPDPETKLPRPTPAGYIHGAAALLLSSLSRRDRFEQAAGRLPWRKLSGLYGRLRP